MAQVLSVSQFVESVRALLRETLTAVTVQGEVTNFRRRQDERQFFEIKDEKSRVQCFALDREIPAVFADGMEVKIVGAPSLFIKNGGFYLRVLEIELVGEGALRKQFELTKRRLEAEGLFAVERKRLPPRFPGTIGIITSPDAAAFTDVCRVLRNRWPLVRLKLASVAVQGSGARAQIVKALEHLSHDDEVSCIILTRGGGSLEDLQAFNDEGVARALFASRIPVIVGVGHERDETIADFVADVRASTPSNAAERAVPDRTEVVRQLGEMHTSMVRALAGQLATRSTRLDIAVSDVSRTFGKRMADVHRVVHVFPSFAKTLVSRIVARREAYGATVARIIRQIGGSVAAAHERNAAITAVLRTLSPLAILERGYSITTTDDGRAIASSTSLHSGSRITTRFAKGRAASTITEVTP